MGVQVVMTAVAVLLMDRAGRRALLLVSLAGMCFCAAAMGAFHLNAQRPTWLVPHLQSIESSVGSVGGVVWEERSGRPGPLPPHLSRRVHRQDASRHAHEPPRPSFGRLALASLVGYIASFSLGLGAAPWLLAGRRLALETGLTRVRRCTRRPSPWLLVGQLGAGSAHPMPRTGAIPWLLMGELFAADVRALAASMATLLNWAFSFTMTLVFAQLNAALGPAGTPLPLLGHLGQSRVISGHLGHLGPAGTFFLFSAICAAGAAFVAACLPETKGRSLAEVQALFGSEAS